MFWARWHVAIGSYVPDRGHCLVQLLGNGREELRLAVARIVLGVKEEGERRRACVVSVVAASRMTYPWPLMFVMVRPKGAMRCRSLEMCTSWVSLVPSLVQAWDASSSAGTG